MKNDIPLFYARLKTIYDDSRIANVQYGNYFNKNIKIYIDLLCILCYTLFKYIFIYKIMLESVIVWSYFAEQKFSQHK